MALRISIAVAVILLAGCASDGVNLQPTRTITITKAVWTPIPARLTEPLALPDFPGEPVTNADLNDYRRAVEQIIYRANQDRLVLRRGKTSD